jgi:hypothetical protein
VLKCSEAVVGPPKSATGRVATLEWRKFVPGGLAAFNPSLRRAFEEGVTAIRLPLYFFLNDKKGLAGGGRLDWRSDTEVWDFAIFVGTVLTIF